MRTVEFVEEIRKIGYKLDNFSIYGEIHVKDVYENYLFIVRASSTYNIYFSGEFHNLEENVKAKLFELIYEYVKTPIEERG